MSITKATIKLEVTDVAKERIQDRMRNCGLSSPIPGIIWAKWSDERQYKWQIGFYEEGEILEGWFLDASGMTIYLYQDWLLDKLDNSILDIINDSIVVRKGFDEVKPEPD